MANNTPDILHVTPHLGGGVGRVLLAYLEEALQRGQRHRLACLEYANEPSLKQAEKLRLELRDRLGLDWRALNSLAAEADLVVLHWWNHPLLYAWLTSGPWPPARLLLWSHVSGRAAPQVITPALAAFPDILAVASPVSLSLPALAAHLAKTRLLFSSAGIEAAARVRPRPHPGFRAGYLGTVDYAKMHPDFLDLCLEADLPGAVFPVAGGPEYEALKKQAESRGASERFEILGPVADPLDFLAGLDVLVYPLNPDHYGTGEQVLIEAQAIGIPPLVLAGGAEEFVVEHERTGLVAADRQDFVNSLRRLSEDRELRSRLGAEARRRAAERFPLANTVAGFDRLYQELMAGPKRPRQWPEAGLPFCPWDFFLRSQGPAAELYERLAHHSSGAGAPAEVGLIPPAGRTATRGSVLHYAGFFPDDERLQRVSRLLAGPGADG